MADSTIKLTFSVGDRVFFFKGPTLGGVVHLPDLVEIVAIEFVPVIQIRNVNTGEVSNARPEDLRGRTEVTDHFNKINAGLSDAKLVDSVIITKAVTAGDVKPGETKGV